MERGKITAQNFRLGARNWRESLRIDLLLDARRSLSLIGTGLKTWSRQRKGKLEYTEKKTPASESGRYIGLQTSFIKRLVLVPALRSGGGGRGLGGDPRPDLATRRLSERNR